MPLENVSVIEYLCKIHKLFSSFCNFLHLSAVAGFNPLNLGSLDDCSTYCGFTAILKTSCEHVTIINYALTQCAGVLHYISLEMFVSDKYSSLLDSFLSYEENEVL